MDCCSICGHLTSFLGIRILQLIAKEQNKWDGHTEFKRRDLQNMFLFVRVTHQEGDLDQVQ